jgi:hypothetical protein
MPIDEDGAAIDAIACNVRNIVSAVDPNATAQSPDHIEQDVLIDVFGFVAYLLVKLH